MSDLVINIKYTAEWDLFISFWSRYWAIILINDFQIIIIIINSEKKIYEIFKENGIQNIKSINSVLRVKKELKFI
jgi:hypothetical protein